MTELPKTNPVFPAAGIMKDLEAFLVDLAYAAGDVIRPYFRSTLKVQNKTALADPGSVGAPSASRSGYDPVTAADREAESRMRELIKARYPDHGIYGEEFGFTPGRAGLTWVLDPIDGTRSFMAGMLHWGVLVALFNGQHSILGCLYQPVLDELFVGNAHRARLQHNNVRTSLSTRRCGHLADAVLCCTDPNMFIATSEQVAFADLLAQTKMSRYGGDCYHYALLAMGLVDLCVEARLRPYDIQALVPIVEGAGGMITTWAGDNPADGGQIVAAADPLIHREALRVLAPAAGKGKGLG